MSRLEERYKNEVVPALMERFGYKNIMEVPKIEKVVVSMGVGDAVADSRALDAAMEDLQIITGQKPMVTRAEVHRASAAGRNADRLQDYLAGERKWAFLDKLLNVALPRIRDFRGVPAGSLDGRGNYSLGIREQLIFPEIDYDKVEKVRGMNITIVTTAKTDEEAYELLRLLGMPFRN